MDEIDYVKKYSKKRNIKRNIKKIDKNIPVQYIVGSTNFYGNEICINKNVLIPRFETEYLVEKTIKLITKYFNEKVSIVDLGTGSGCIAISLKKELPNSSVTAIDISSKALSVAKKNARRNKTIIKFSRADMGNIIDGKYDVIISNPPYISPDEDIMPLVYNNEPHLALFAGNEGLYYYEQIIKNSVEYTNKKNIIAFEIGQTHATRIKKLAKLSFPNSRIIVEKDANKKDRYLFILNNCE